jgi:hypothetical protein
MKKAQKKLATFLLVFLISFSQPLMVLAKKPDTPPGQEKQSNSSNNGNNSPAVQGATDSVQPATTSNYQFEVQSLNLPANSQTDQIINTDVTLKNTSSFEWQKTGDGKIELTYHWVDQNGQLEVYRGDITALASNVIAGATITQKFQVRTPSIPGTFKLSFDLIKGDKWFTTNGPSKYFKEIKIEGSVSVNDEDQGMSINDGAKYANNPVLSVEVIPYSNQPGSDSAGFIFDYVQATDAKPEDIVNGTAKWSTWELMSDPWAKSKIKATLTNESVGIKRLYIRYRAFKKQSDLPAEGFGTQAGATPLDYGSAMYHYGRSEKSTGAYYADEIFFDNVPPVGSVKINNGDYSTTIRTGSLQITATDEVNGVMGSGLDGMRWTNNCNLNDLEANNWSAWEAEVGDKSNVDLGTGTKMVICIQVRDKATNVATFVDDIIFYVPPTNGGGNGGGILDPGNESYIGPDGNRIVSKLAGVSGNPYGNKSQENLGETTIKIYSSINPFGRNTWVSDINFPAPEITYIDVSDDKKKVSIMGIAIPKNDKASFEISYEIWIPNCWSVIYSQCIEVKTSNISGNLEHVGLSLYKDEWGLFGPPELYWLWNDQAEGLWNINMDLGNSIKLDDKIYAVSKAWGIINTNIPEIGNFDYGAGNRIVSGKSNIEEVVDTEISSLREYIQNTYKIKVVNGTADWDQNQLLRLKETLEIVPVWVYNDYLEEIRREIENPSNESADGYTNKDRAGRSIEMYNDAGSGVGFREVMIHELMHVYQFKYGGRRNDSHTNPEAGSVVERYYQTAGFEKLPTPKQEFNGLRYYEYKNSTNHEFWEDFVSYYAKNGAETNKPFEEMAESMTFFLLDKSAFTVFDEERDKVGFYTMYDIKDGDIKSSELLKSKYNFVDTNIF